MPYVRVQGSAARRARVAVPGWVRCRVAGVAEAREIGNISVLSISRNRMSKGSSAQISKSLPG